MTKKWSEIKRSKGVIEEAPKELKNCPRCGRKMSWLETDDGVTQWCYWEQSQLLDRKL